MYRRRKGSDAWLEALDGDQTPSPQRFEILGKVLSVTQSIASRFRRHG